MTKNNLKRWEPTIIQNDTVILPAYSDLSKRCISLIRKLECPIQYIDDMLRGLADALISLYPEVKDKNSKLYKF